MVPFYTSSSSSTAPNKAESSLRRHCKWIPFLVRSIHPSTSLISFPALFIAIAHCHPPFPNLDFCSIYQISSPSHNSILSYSVFSTVLNLSHFQLTFCFVLFCFFCFFLFFCGEDHRYCFLVRGSNATAGICNLFY